MLAVHPVDATADHYVGENLWVDFDINAPAAEVTLANAAGEDVPGSSTWLSETRYDFDPKVNLAHTETYTATVHWGPKDDPQTQSWSFTTSTVGDTPVEASMVDQTFAYNLAESTVVAPAGGGAILDQFSGTFLQGVTAQSETEISFLGALAVADSDPPEQDLTNPAIDLNENEPAIWLDPYFLAGPADLPQTLDIPSFGQVDVTFRDVTISGVFAASVPEGTVDQILEGTFAAVVDVRDAGFGDVCDQLGLIVEGLTCVTCPHDPSSDQCIIFDLIDLQAELVPGLVLVP